MFLISLLLSLLASTTALRPRMAFPYRATRAEGAKGGAGQTKLLEILEQRPQLSSLLRSEAAQYGICTGEMVCVIRGRDSLHPSPGRGASAPPRPRRGRTARPEVPVPANEAVTLDPDRAIASAEKTHERDNIYAAYAKGILADALFAEGKFEEAAAAYAEGLKAYERHYHGKTSPDEIEVAGGCSHLMPKL